MSTAECVDTSINTAVFSHYIDESTMDARSAVINLKGTVIKSDLEDVKKLRNYFDIIVKKRKEKHWKQFYEASKDIL